MNPSEVALTLEQAKRLAELDPKHFWIDQTGGNNLLLSHEGTADKQHGYTVARYDVDGTPAETWHPLPLAMYHWMLSQMAETWDEFTTGFVNGGTPMPGVREQYEALKPAMKADGSELGSEAGKTIILSSYIAYLEAKAAGGSK